MTGIGGNGEATSPATYRDAQPTWANGYLWRPVVEILGGHKEKERRVFEVGCGNGATAKFLTDLGFDVVGVDPSPSGIAMAKASNPNLQLYVGDAYDDLAGQYGEFPFVISLEVIEHCFSPRIFLQTVFDLLEEGGTGIISTPFHGYWKNLALALSGRLDNHFTVLWEGGHIKFFSVKTLKWLLRDIGFNDIEFIKVGRVPVLAKSMIAVVRK